MLSLKFDFWPRFAIWRRGASDGKTRSICEEDLRQQVDARIELKQLQDAMREKSVYYRHFI